MHRPRQVGAQGLLHSCGLLRDATGIGDPGTIVFGCDVHHPKPGSDRPSFAALVASMDMFDYAEHLTLVQKQPTRMEVVIRLQAMVEGVRYIFSHPLLPGALPLLKPGLAPAPEAASASWAVKLLGKIPVRLISQGSIKMCRLPRRDL